MWQPATPQGIQKLWHPRAEGRRPPRTPSWQGRTGTSRVLTSTGGEAFSPREESRAGVTAQVLEVHPQGNPAQSTERVKCQLPSLESPGSEDPFGVNSPRGKNGLGLLDSAGPLPFQAAAAYTKPGFHPAPDAERCSDGSWLVVPGQL